MKLPGRTWLAAAALAAAALSCRRQDLRTATIAVPELKNEQCAAIITEALQRSQGIAPENIRVDLAARTVTVTYDSLQRARKNLEYCIAKAGFSANEIPADAEAAKALPPECR